MWSLYQHTLCPFSRVIRLVLAEKRIAHQLVVERPWEERPEFLALNPAAQTPVLQWVDEPTSRPEVRAGIITISDCAAITEYLEEIIKDVPLMGSGPLERAEVRRIAGWFHQLFYAECGVLLLRERMWNRVVSLQTPNTGNIRAALAAADKHLGYIDDLIDQRRWLGGGAFSLADIVAAAHVSVADYLGGINWEPHDPAKQWYMAMKSRPSFRQLLVERMPGLMPPSHYDKLDF